MKEWFFRKFLPEWCREELLAQLASMSSSNRELKEENERLKAYITGVKDALRAGRKIVIQNGGTHGNYHDVGESE